jgi:hypothetical protein
MIPRQLGIWLLAPLLAIGAGTVYAANAGRVQFVYGDVRVVDAAGNERRVRRGAAIGEGDTIRTSGRSAAQLKMIDGAALAIRAKTEVRIDNYQFKNDEKKDRSFLSLLRGTFRSITGAIGRSKRSNYSVATATATIGIRGSDADIGFSPDTGLVAVRTNLGGHSVTTNGTPSAPSQTLQTNIGQIATALPGQPPQFATAFPFETPTPPAAARRASAGSAAQGGAEGGEQAGAGDGDSQQNAGNEGQGLADGNGGGFSDDGEGGFRGDDDGGGPGNAGRGVAGRGVAGRNGPRLRRVSLRLGLTTGGIEADQITTETALVNDIGDFTRIPESSFVVGAFLSGAGNFPDASVGAVSGANATSSVLTDDAGNVVEVRDGIGPNAFIFNARNAQLGFANEVAIVDRRNGNKISDVRFGYWSSDFQVFGDGLNEIPIGAFHFAVAKNLTSIAQLQQMNGIGFAHIQTAGVATNETGAMSSSLVSTMSGVFQNDATLGVIGVSIAATFPTGSTNWFLDGGGNIANFGSNNGIPIGGECCGTPAAAGPPVLGRIIGRFAGAEAQGIVAGFGASSANGASRITGTIVAER